MDEQKRKRAAETLRTLADRIEASDLDRVDVQVNTYHRPLNAFSSDGLVPHRQDIEVIKITAEFPSE